MEVPGPLLDIGLPETYLAAPDFVRRFGRQPFVSLDLQRLLDH
jgi:hypothetical protein